MKTLRRFTASIVSSFESVVSQLENHEALVSAAIRDAEVAAGRAKGQLARVQRDGQAMRKRVNELRDESEIWRDRAARCAQIDQQKAIECLRRHKRFVKQADTVEEQLLNHAKLERQLTGDLTMVQEKLVSLRQQRNLLRTRQSRAEALRMLQSVESSAIGEIDDLFDRWESKIASVECEPELLERSTDDFAVQFTSVEEDEQLRSELATLVEKAEQKVVPQREGF